jgi:hypothetical protein
MFSGGIKIVEFALWLRSPILDWNDFKPIHACKKTSVGVLKSPNRKLDPNMIDNYQEKSPG